MKRGRDWRRLQVSRAFTATVTLPNGQTFTTTIHGSNPSDAERIAEAERGPGAVVVVRSEQH